MRFAVTVKGHGFNVHTTGSILMIVGIIGAVISIAFWASRGGFGGRAFAEEPDVERTLVREREVH